MIGFVVFLVTAFCPVVLSDNALRASETINADQIEVQECIVRFGAEIEVPALETGRIASVMVKRNDTLHPRNLIARLDDQSLLIRRRAAQLRMESAREDAEDDVEIRYADAALAEAQAELDNSRSIQNDVRGSIPLTQMRRMRLAVERGELEVAQAKKRKSRAVVEMQLKQADLAALDDQLENLRCESPLEGIVLDVTREEGEWIEKGQTLAKIGKLSQMHVHALVKSDLIAPMHCQGLPVSVHWVDSVDGSNRSLSGKVLSVDPQTLPGGRFRLHAEIENQMVSKSGKKYWLLMPGTSVRMKVYVPADSLARKQSLRR
jgi:multidrug resistance efflux pump